MLADALDAWEREGNPEETAFVRRLFFHADGGAPGRHSPHELREAVRAGQPREFTAILRWVCHGSEKCS
jgi:hypothetical protein